LAGKRLPHMIFGLKSQRKKGSLNSPPYPLYKILSQVARRATENHGAFLCVAQCLLFFSLCNTFTVFYVTPCFTELHGGGTEGHGVFLCGSQRLLFFSLCNTFTVFYVTLYFTESHGGGTENHRVFSLCGSVPSLFFSV
jgi:hypothetical protein